MTSPVQPGVVTPDQNRVEQRIARVQRQADELQRRNLANARVGQGGRFSASLSAIGPDVLAIAPGAPVYGSRQVLRLNDIAGSPVFQHDELAGYGLSAPIYTYFMAPIPGTTSTVGVEAAFATSEPFVYNPAWFSKVLVRNMLGAATSWSVRFKVSAPGQADIYSSAATFTGGATFLSRCVLLPAVFMNYQNVIGSWVATPNGTGSIDVWPLASAGRSKAFYDQILSLH